MGLSRYLSKLGQMLNSSGQVQAAGIAPGAAGTLSWIPCTNSNNTTPWVKLCTISGGANDRVSLLLSGTASFSANDDTIAGGATIHMTLGNDANANNLNLNVINSSAANVLVTGCYVVKGATDFIWDVWVKTQEYARINAFAYGNIYAISATYVDQLQTTKPTGGYDKRVGRQVTSLTQGAVLQVSQATASGTVNTTNTGMVDLTGLSVTLTVSANSKILIMGTSGCYSAGGTWPGGRLFIADSANVIQSYGEHMSTVTSEAQCFQHTLHHLTGALSAGTYTFKLGCNSIVGSATSWNRDNYQGRIVLMEIAG